MSRLGIVKYPDPVLRKKAARVERVTPEMQSFIAEMQSIMREANGVGLAAPQLGISLRIVVIEVDDEQTVLINPQITREDGQQTGAEGCLSLPGLHGEVTRAQRVTVTALNARGKKITLSGDGLWARAVQHELDHLDGILFIDRVDPATLYWATGDVDDEGHYVTRDTTLEEAVRFFTQEAALARR